LVLMSISSWIIVSSDSLSDMWDLGHGGYIWENC
jgi:hypothetical protein